MFTGIVEEIGHIRRITRGSRSAKLEIACKKVCEGTKIGDSIAVNGICLTVTALSPAGFSADVMPETLDRTALSALTGGSAVNLERALAANGRFGGHIVSGHIDGSGVLTHIEREDNAVWLTFSCEPALLRYVVEKGSIAIDGTSLTVARVTAADFSVSLIPHTLAETVLGLRKVGDFVNLECDIIGKYVEKLLTPARGTPQQSGITKEFLAEYGF